MNRFKIRGRSGMAVIILVVIQGLFLTGCADLSAIRKFAETSSQAESYKAITNDYIRSEERQLYYVKGKERRDRLATDIKKRQELVGALLALQTLMAKYMQSLGALAADELPAYDEEIDSLVGALEKAAFFKESGISAKELTAGSNIAKLLARAATDAYRQNKLREVISAANADIQIIIAKQKEILTDYKRSLVTEQREMIDYYGQVIVKSIPKEYFTDKEPKPEYYGDIIIDAKMDPPQKAALLLLRDHLQEKLTAAEERKKAISEYEKVLDNIAAGHQHLFANRDALSKDLVISTIKGYSANISRAYEALITLNLIRGGK